MMKHSRLKWSWCDFVVLDSQNSQWLSADLSILGSFDKMAQSVVEYTLCMLVQR